MHALRVLQNIIKQETMQRLHAVYVQAAMHVPLQTVIVQHAMRDIIKTVTHALHVLRNIIRQGITQQHHALPARVIAPHVTLQTDIAADVTQDIKHQVQPVSVVA